MFLFSKLFYKEQTITFCINMFATVSKFCILGLGYRQLIDIVPPGIEIACRNSNESCTISGPAEEKKYSLSNL